MITMTTSMLAAVRAAAESASPADDPAPVQTQGANMDKKDAAPAGDNQGISKSEHEAAIVKATTDAKVQAKSEFEASLAKIKADAKAEGLSEGVAAERARILGIESVALPGHGDLIKTMKADGKTTPGEAAVKIVEAERVKRAGQLDEIAGVEAHTGKLASLPLSQANEKKPTGNQVAQTPDGWKAEWQANKDLQTEFEQVEIYVAYKKADANGQVRRLVNRTAA
jgi:hypothetical protein